VANPSGDLPAAEVEGVRVAELLRANGIRVTFLRGEEANKQNFLLALREHDLVHFAGHADHDAASPDESGLLMYDGPIQAFEIARFLRDPTPSVVFLNACWSAEEALDVDVHSPMMRGLGRTFMIAGVAAFLGYLVPVPDASATSFAVEFYGSLAVGHSIRRGCEALQTFRPRELSSQ
jgi:CHAT domain-containing protein